ncbi:DCC1-like thiol-disulfide oxidoreductase family protein [Prosthecobacter sp.]|uniref:DCC1-like thiol-disulfide oxidoreductase family protein n=1 Tax=Prosthecobacter sp. TaxID=1965333 RepID=UPI003784474F
MIFKQGTSAHLGIARVLVYTILLADLLLDNVPALAAMPAAAFLPRGVLAWLPASWLHSMLQGSFLHGFSLAYGVVLLLGLLGLGRAWLVTGLALLGTTFFHGIARGFGGHVNHQELLGLHVLFFFLTSHSFAAFSLNSLLWKNTPQEDAGTVSRVLLRSLCFMILLTYFFIGVARLQTSDWRVYGTNAMTFYALQHSTKWNYWDFSLARGLLHQPLFALFLKVAFPMATILELAAPLAVLVRRLVWPIIISLFLFHVSILLTMNIFFWQNMVLLLLPAMGWYVDRNWQPATDSGKPLLVFYDAACGLCDGFIRHVAKADKAGLIRFAPLNGMTAREHNIVLPEQRAEWTIMAVDGTKVMDRSDAVLHILAKTSLWADIADLATVVPRFVRDAIYRKVARWRHLMPLKSDACELPSLEMRRKLLP